MFAGYNDQGCGVGVGVARSRRFLGGFRVGFLRILRVGDGVGVGTFGKVGVVVGHCTSDSSNLMTTTAYFLYLLASMTSTMKKKHRWYF